MYVDLILLIVLLLIVILVFRRWSNFVYALVIIDIFLRMLDFLRRNIPIPDFQSIIIRYFPASVPGIISKYTTGLLYNSFMWFLAAVYAFFLFYTVRIFMKKSK